MDTNDPDAEATLEALRVAIGQPTSPSIHPISELPPLPQSPPHILPEAHMTIASNLAALNALNDTNGDILDGLDTEVVNGIEGLKGLVDNCKKQYEIVKQLSDHFIDLESNIDPSLSIFGASTIPRAQYDALQARYDSLLDSTTPQNTRTREVSPADEELAGRRQAKRVRRFKGDVNEVGAGEGGAENLDSLIRLEGVADQGAENGKVEVLESLLPLNGEKKRKRSMKLEHLIHKMANRRLGVCYTIKDFECLGTTTLPSPSSEPPGPESSVNHVQEYRPDYAAEGVSGYRVQPFLDVVCEDVWDAWEGGVGVGEAYLGIDRKKVRDSVQVYWVRLQKRYVEQLARQRGEIHKDEVTRRKQNQFRRQQSLLARRIVAFDASPLNSCKLRGLYRTLLTIDFASPTNDRPDSNRVYNEDEWYAYQKLGGGGVKGIYQGSHEVVDLFWLSPQCRDLLLLLDTFSLTFQTQQKRKGRPKTPSPTFHLPPTLWDRTNLPHLRPKDLSGLPIPNSTGLILFKFHVDEGVQRDYPDWAQGLYDHPPVGGDDVLLPGLKGVVPRGLKALIKGEKRRREVGVLSDGDVAEIVAGEELPERFLRKVEEDEVEDMDVDDESETHLVGGAGIESSGVHDTGLDSVINSHTLDTALINAEQVDIGVGEIKFDNPLDGNMNVDVGETISENLESSVNLAHQHEHEHEHDQGGSGRESGTGDGAGGGGGRAKKRVGPSAGSSLRARKQSKKHGGGVVVDGMAEPFDKREVGVGAEGLVEVEKGLGDDQGFLGGL